MGTAVELARQLGVDPKVLRAWLRRQASAGHPLLAGHERHGRWKFSDADLHRLASEYRGRTPAAVERVPTFPAAQKASPKRADAGHRVVEQWRGESVETLADLLRPGLRAVCVGINPSPVSVDVGHYYQGRLGKRIWARLRQVGILSDDVDGFEDDSAFAANIGFTDLVKRPSARAHDLDRDELEAGRVGLVAKVKRYRPRLLVFTFKDVAAVCCGPFPGHGFVGGVEIAGIPGFVMPGPYERSDRVARALTQLAERI